MDIHKKLDDLKYEILIKHFSFDKYGFIEQMPSIETLKLVLDEYAECACNEIIASAQNISNVEFKKLD